MSRRLKISTLHRSRGVARTVWSKVPQLRLAGEWLAQAGFRFGAGVTVEVQAGRLVITTEGKVFNAH